MFMPNDLIKQVNIQQIADQGMKIYEEIKDQYDPLHRGRFLALDVESKNAYLSDTSEDALEQAREHHPDHIFYVVKIGYDAAETIAHSLARSER